MVYLFAAERTSMFKSPIHVLSAVKPVFPSKRVLDYLSGGLDIHDIWIYLPG